MNMTIATHIRFNFVQSFDYHRIQTFFFLILGENLRNLPLIAAQAICLSVRYTGFPSTVPLTWPKTRRNKNVMDMMTAKQIQYVLTVYLSARSVSVVEK